MNESDLLAEVRRWLPYGREDLQAAQGIVDTWRMPPRHACWLAQQAAEKALKAILVYLQVDFPRRHDLDALRDLVPDDWRVKAGHPNLSELTEWAVEARYPGNWADPTEADARSAVQQARAVCESVIRDLRQHGVDIGAG